MPLERLGFDPWLRQRLDGMALEGRRLARVISVDRDSCEVLGEFPAVRAELTGRLMFNAASPMDLPAVGDWVVAQYFDADSFAVVHDILPRKSVLKRKTSGKNVEHQLLAANLDTAFVVQSLDDNFNLRRLERYLVMIHDGGIEPVLLLSKSDCASAEDVAQRIREVRATVPGLPVLAFSNRSEAGFQELHQWLKPAKTYCLLGSSGVGKTTLVNRLVGMDAFETRSVRKKDGKGRHTTSRRQLIFLPNDAMIIDTPGMRELGNIGVASGLQAAFGDIQALAKTCQYRDCSHEHEDGCAVLAAVASGKLARDRYRNYLRIAEESAYHEMSYLEKRKKDKAFGKYCKAVMKEKKRRPS